MVMLLNYIAHDFRAITGVNGYILSSITAKVTESETRLTEFKFLFCTYYL